MLDKTPQEIYSQRIKNPEVDDIRFPFFDRQFSTKLDHRENILNGNWGAVALDRLAMKLQLLFVRSACFYRSKPLRM